MPGRCTRENEKQQHGECARDLFRTEIVVRLDTRFARTVAASARRPYQPPTRHSTVIASTAQQRTSVRLPWPRGSTMNAASSGPTAEPALPPTWNSDCASPC